MDTLLEFKGIMKQFPGVRALDGITFEVRRGEVHGLVGENGAGKSTLMHILAGVYPPDAGTLVLEGREVRFGDEQHAQTSGIGMVFQERSLVGSLSIAENIFVGRQPVKMLNWVDRKSMNRQAGALLKRVGLDLDATAMVSTLSSIEQQLVEIAKALSLDARILILDEPTATITEIETQILFDLIRDLKEKGISVIYISHRLEELSSICDRVSVLKDGVYQGTRTMAEVSLDEIITMMVGRKILNVYDDRGWKTSEPILQVRNLSSTAFSGVSFDLATREIFGIAGLAGAGRTEIALALFGADPYARGDVTLRGAKVHFRRPEDAINAGIGYLTEDRKAAGLFLELPVAQNIISANLQAFTRRGLVRDRTANDECGGFVARLRINTPSLRQLVMNLSGGNQQKVLLARWLMKNSEILIIDEPTRGVDVGAKNEIYEFIRQMAKDGTSIIAISSELPELLILCDRIMVMCQGRKTGELLHGDATEEKLMHLCAGIPLEEEAARGASDAAFRVGGAT
ncbi:MAG: sugar ABC transporter ATP-binding protein [Spirochaetia bacterium]|jgi:ABC-type sugar transport system ATPase subunit